MGEPFTVVSWNLHRAAVTSGAWDVLWDLHPDLALLQEVGKLRPWVTDAYTCTMAPAMGITAQQSFHTALLVRGQMGPAVPLTGPEPWINNILEAYKGNLVGLEVCPRNGPTIKVISVYSPPFQIPTRYLEDNDLGVLNRTQTKGVWLTDVLLAALEHNPPKPGERWIIGGDFNLAETFDGRKGFAGGNAAWLARMQALGFTECLRKIQGRATPTFQHSNKTILHQMDHIFVSEPLAHELAGCEVGDRARVFAEPLLSDHLPVVAQFGG